MARGWESKSVESQMEDAAARRANATSAAAQQPDTGRLARRRALELDLLRVRGELSRCASPRFRALLEAEIRHLEAELLKHPA